MTEKSAQSKEYFHVEQDRGVSVVIFTEPTLLDAFHITEVGKELIKLVDNQGLRIIALDLSTIKMLSSQALGVLLDLRHRLADCGGKLGICGVDPRLYRVFKITNLQTVFEFYQDRANAVDAMQ